MNQKITDENLIMHAMKWYDNPSCHSMEEFYEDLSRIKYIKRLLSRYKRTGEIKERLLLNHIIIMGNIFSPEGACRILFHCIEEDHYSYLKTVLEFLNYLPRQIPEANLVQINTDSTLWKNLNSLDEMK